MRPKSTGKLLLASPDPARHVLIDPNYLACEQDRREMRASIRLSREIFAQPAFTEQFAGVERAPGEEMQTDAQLDEFSRAFGDSAYHPSCTCRMGDNPDGHVISDEDRRRLGHVGNGRINAAVTQANCKVWGLDGLRVVDASIMPSIVSGNLNAPVIMMAERAADIILSDLYGESMMLPAENAPWWKPTHPERQRDGTASVSHK